MSLNIFRFFVRFSTNLLTIFFDSYTFIFWLFSSDTLQVLMFVWPTVSELRFYGCCHSCFQKIIYFFWRSKYWKTKISLYNISATYINPYNKVTRSVCVCLYRRISLTDVVLFYNVSSHCPENISSSARGVFRSGR